MDKKRVVIFSLAIVVVLLISGCEQYFGQGSVGERIADTSSDDYANEDDFNVASKPVGDDSGYNPRNDPTFIDCTLTENAINPFCTPETGVGIEADSSFMGFSAQDKILRSLDLEQSRMDNLAAKGKLAYVSSTDQWKLTLQTIQEINVLIGLPKDATAADREKWYADWAIQEDQKFAAAIAKGTEEQIAAEYDSRIQELVDQSRLAAGEGAEDAIAQALDAADKAVALKAEKEKAIAMVRTNENTQWIRDNQNILIRLRDETDIEINTYSPKTNTFIDSLGNQYKLNQETGKFVLIPDSKAEGEKIRGDIFNTYGDSEQAKGNIRKFGLGGNSRIQPIKTVINKDNKMNIVNTYTVGEYSVIMTIRADMVTGAREDIFEVRNGATSFVSDFISGRGGSNVFISTFYNGDGSVREFIYDVYYGILESQQSPTTTLGN